MKNIIKWHQYTALIALVPLLIWLGSGLTLNLINHKEHSGNDHRVSVNRETKRVQELISIAQAISKTKPAVKVELISLLNNSFYLIHHDYTDHSYFESDKTLVNAQSGELFEFSQATAEQLALSSYNGEMNNVETQLLKPPIADLNKERNPVWQIKTNDDLNTHIYVRANTGEIIAHINDNRRFKDLMLRLHFLDLANVGSFNNWQNIFFALILLALSITGVIWFVKSLKNT